jgi:tripartite-type tricarboxylate transporter receptor subunit TctC
LFKSFGIHFAEVTKKEGKMGLHLFKSKISIFLCFVVILLFTERGYAQDEEIAKYPSRPITFICPIPPGGGTDLSLRAISKEAEKFLGQPIVVVNKSGGGQSIGMAAIATSKPDGYTIGQSGNSGLLLVPHMEKVPYHTVKDFKQIIQCGGFNFGIFLKADSSFNTFKDVIAYARQNPKKLTYGCTTNSIQYLIMEQIAKREKVQFTHIPFKGTPEVQTALLGGHIFVGIGDFNYSLVEAGQIKIPLLLREERSAEYPQTPILKDLDYEDIPAPYYLGICGPKGIPEGIVRKLEDAFAKAMKEPAFIKGMQELRLPIIYRSSKELGDYVIHNYELFGKIFKEIQKKQS